MSPPHDTTAPGPGGIRSAAAHQEILADHAPTGTTEHPTELFDPRRPAAAPADRGVRP
ncbi:hypothetical protein [Streptomyces sp. NRRL S-337]|uniref:hypothetical protein n=1 Tax=Streptomyces sp. NRRL S-337 TaxID=1463900 RepID=UPI000ACD808E|nr:hypothetical protein [Streptomyces sp. NRRL S-337]